jgi:hypothetical protein
MQLEKIIEFVEPMVIDGDLKIIRCGQCIRWLRDIDSQITGRCRVHDHSSFSNSFCNHGTEV